MKGGSCATHSACACERIMQTHSKGSGAASDSGDKSRKADTEPPPFLYSISAQSLSLRPSLTTVCRSIQRTIRKERRGRGERKREKKKKNEGSELSPPPRLLFNTATERGRERARLSKRKSDRGCSPLTKYKAVASEQSVFS